MKKIAVFASGSGTNAQKIFERFEHHDQIKVEVLFCNKSEAKVLERAKKFGITTRVFDKQTFIETTEILQELKHRGVDFVVLAGFLWLIPGYLVNAYERRMINIHPALLPKYGGKGMYGMKVHESVVANKEKETGITIHYVDPAYDEGNIVFQAKCAVDKNDTAEDVAQKIHQLEHQHFPEVIEKLVLEL